MVFHHYKYWMNSLVGFGISIGSVFVSQDWNCLMTCYIFKQMTNWLFQILLSFPSWLSFFRLMSLNTLGIIFNFKKKLFWQVNISLGIECEFCRFHICAALKPVLFFCIFLTWNLKHRIIFIIYLRNLTSRISCLLQQIKEMIADVDKDGSGAIDFNEFLHMMTAKMGERDTKEELMKAFRIIDQDKNVIFFICLHCIYIHAYLFGFSLFRC